MLYPYQVQMHGFGQAGTVFLVGQVAVCRMPELDVVGHRLHIGSGVGYQQSALVFRHQAVETRQIKPIRILSLADMPNPDITRFGQVGSPTTVERIFPPEKNEQKVNVTGDAEKQSDELLGLLRGKKII